jgi:hypothetical protein
MLNYLSLLKTKERAKAFKTGLWKISEKYPLILLSLWYNKMLKLHIIKA